MQKVSVYLCKTSSKFSEAKHFAVDRK